MVLASVALAVAYVPARRHSPSIQSQFFATTDGALKTVVMQ